MEALDEATVSSLDAGGEAVCGGADVCVRPWEDRCRVGHLQAAAVLLARARVASGEGGPGRSQPGARSGAREPEAERGPCDQGSRSGFLTRCVAQNRGSTPAQQRLRRDCIYEQVQVMQSAAHLSIESMCRLGQVSRAGFYRHWQQREPRAEQTELRAAIQQIVLAHRRNYGYRRITREVRNQGWAVNHKRVARLMAEDNLLCLRKRRFVATTDSGHDLRG